MLSAMIEPRTVGITRLIDLTVLGVPDTHGLTVKMRSLITSHCSEEL